MIIIDTREPTDKIIDILFTTDLKIPDFLFQALPFGDYLLISESNLILIERKDLGDFCNSYTLLKRRMDEMRKRAENTALLLEGTYYKVNGSICLWRGNQLCESMNAKTFANFKMSQQARGSYLIETNDLADSIETLIYLHDYLDTLGNRPVRKSRELEELILSIPGMGIEKLKMLKTRYRSPKVAFEHIAEWKTRLNLDEW